MNTIEHLRELFEYDRWGDARTISALQSANSDRSLRILAHILLTKQEYFERLSGKDSTGFDFWPELSIEQCRQLCDNTNRNYESLLKDSDEAGLERIARYKTSEGVSRENTFRDLLTHVLLHSSIHRGNIVLKMREEGLEPPKIDYIIYLRTEGIK
jgi:uncharacterized damage-inducible protein DinB